MIRRYAPLLLAAILCLSCKVARPIAELFHSDSPYEQYFETLKGAGLVATALGRDWENAGIQALARPVTARLPFRETGYFPPHSPIAIAYRVELRRGRNLTIRVDFDSQRPGRLFVDLFRLVEGEPPDRVASLATDTTTMTYHVRRDGSYVLRLQPELLRGGRYTVVEQAQASVRFPVPGLSTRAVQSRFGVERDAGARTHHGIDIFAPRGTPVIAVTDGMARPGTNRLGGNVVWLYHPERGQNFYYAHLDRWASEESRAVRVGDTLGFIGNTGNARTTRPHLHFGVYDGGPVDPEPFVELDDPAPPGLLASVDRLDEWVRVTAPRAELRNGAHRGAAALSRLEPGFLARVHGVSQGAFRVSFPDESIGYLDASAVTRADRALRQQRLDSGTVLRESPAQTAPAVYELTAESEADVLGRFGEFELVRLPDARLGWIGRPASGDPTIGDREASRGRPPTLRAGPSPEAQP